MENDRWKFLRHSWKQFVAGLEIWGIVIGLIAIIVAIVIGVPSGIAWLIDHHIYSPIIALGTVVIVFLIYLTGKDLVN